MALGVTAATLAASWALVSWVNVPGASGSASALLLVSVRQGSPSSSEPSSTTSLPEESTSSSSTTTPVSSTDCLPVSVPQYVPPSTWDALSPGTAGCAQPVYDSQVVGAIEALRTTALLVGGITTFLLAALLLRSVKP